MPRTPTYAETILADRPVVYYRLGETSGTVAADSSGNGVDGTYIGSPTLDAAGAPVADADGSVGLDGTSQYIEIASASVLNDLEKKRELSVEAWVYATATRAVDACGIVSREFQGLPAIGGEELRFVLGYGEGSALTGWTGGSSANKVWFNMYRNDGYVKWGYAVVDPDPLPLNTWVHYVGVVREWRQVRLYKNGLSVNPGVN